MKSSIKDWRPAKVLAVHQAAEDIMSIQLMPKTWIPHKAGQHYELRLPGHYLSRKYSIVSSPHQTDSLEFGVQLLPYGEVSPKLWKLKPGDALEIRGPLGAFVWTPDVEGPLIMIAAGSGVTPFLSMYDHFKYARPDGQVVLIMSAKTSSRVMHYDKHQKDMITRFTSQDGRVDKAFLEKAVGKYASDPTARCLTCGPGGFTSHVIGLLQQLGFSPGQIRRESFS